MEVKILFWVLNGAQLFTSLLFIIAIGGFIFDLGKRSAIKAAQDNRTIFAKGREWSITAVDVTPRIDNNRTIRIELKEQ